MYAFKIKGGKPLAGTIEVKGAKNAVLPIMAAALLTSKKVELQNIFYLADVSVLSQLLESLGMKVEHKTDSILLQADAINNLTASYDFVSKMRASFWVLGPLLGRFGTASVSLPGGCAIGARPVDLYLMALRQMGAEITIENGYVNATGKLHGAEIVFPKKSVGATHNTLMAAVLAEGVTTLINPALEPEVMDLIDILQKMGAKIEGVGTAKLIITGVPKLHGVTHSIVTDRIETASFAIATAITKGNVFIKGGRIDLMEPIVEILRSSDVILTQETDGLRVDATQAVLRSSAIITAEYPGFPTDAQAPLTPLLALANGVSTVSERIFENRFMHVPELERMGAHITVLPGDTISIQGVEKLSAATVMSSDLRGGMALVIAALTIQEESTIKRIYHIDRGYYKLEDRLSALGADIKRFRDE